MQELIGKKILILGGNIETAYLVQEANRLGMITHVLDPNPEAPAKRFASNRHDIEATDVNAVLSVVKKHDIDGVLVGVADILVNTYQKVCEALDLPCYVNSKSGVFLTNKDKFSALCKQFDVSPIPQYPASNFQALINTDISFPVVVKPVDNGAGVGMSICTDIKELEIGFEYALACSRKKQVVVERYMNCDDIAVYYTIIDGVAHLSAIIDRYKSTSHGVFKSICVGALYNSKYRNAFLEKIHPKFQKIFDFLEIQNGILCIQLFVDQDGFYAYDPGFRLQGEGFHIPLKYINGFDHRHMLLNFAITGKFFEGDFSKFNDATNAGKCVATVWVLLNPGKIASIVGLDLIKKHKAFLDIVQRFGVGDVVDDTMLGTERQVFARIYLAAEDFDMLRCAVESVHNQLFVLSDSQSNMIADYFRF